MGGVIIIFSVLISTILWADIHNKYIIILLFTLLSYGALGIYDDYSKIKNYSSDGISGKTKLFWQTLLSIIIIYMVLNSFKNEEFRYNLRFPCFKDLAINLGVFYFVFATIVVVGSSNAVNLTDGLDGLAIVPIIIAFACFALICYILGHSIFADYLKFFYIPNIGEIAVFCSCIIGAGMGFLWYNAQPAQVFMGDVGSLSLGATLGVISVITKHEILLSIIGGLFVIEAISVILQVSYFKISGKRIFKMSPIHHHFEKNGWSETKIVVRFWIIAVIFALLGLATLKIR